MASHLLLSPTFSTVSCCWLVICFLTALNYVETLTYDRQSLLDICSRCMVVSEMKLGKFVDIPHMRHSGFSSSMAAWQHPEKALEKTWEARRSDHQTKILSASCQPTQFMSFASDHGLLAFCISVFFVTLWLCYTLTVPQALPESPDRPPWIYFLGFAFSLAQRE